MQHLKNKLKKNNTVKIVKKNFNAIRQEQMNICHKGDEYMSKDR